MKMQLRTIGVVFIILMAAWGSAHAQVVDIPDFNLSAAIREKLDLPQDAPITRDDMRRLVRINFSHRAIQTLDGIEFATELRTVNLAWNQLTDITPLATLTRINYLDLSGNKITDITPLANLTRLDYLEIQTNPVFDYSPLEGLYDDNQPCRQPQLPLRERLANRNFPSVYQAWGSAHWSPILNQPHLSGFEQAVQHDLYWCCLMFGGDYIYIGDEMVLLGNLDEMARIRDEHIARNPNMIFLVQLGAVWADLTLYPSDSEYWLRDENGQIVGAWEASGTLNLNNPAFQKLMIDQAVAVSECGIYDGIMIDGWHEPHFAREGLLDGAESILKGIRERVQDDFLILVNTNQETAPVSAPYINGLFLESGVPRSWDDPADGFRLLEDRLSWAEENLREPRINAPQGHAYDGEPLDSPTNLQWMRAVTTLTLTFTDGCVLIKTDTWEGKHAHWHYWYDFWDADLGQPVGEKSKLYDDAIPGLYIREFTNGWAVYNHSGSAQLVTLPEKVRSVTSGLGTAGHAVLNLDGVINILDLVVVANQF